jgi:hypothetical protein
MADGITEALSLKLTPAQKKQLAPLFELCETFYQMDSDNRAALFAQPMSDGRLQVRFYYPKGATIIHNALREAGEVSI